MPAQPKMTRLDRMLYTLRRGNDGNCNSCVHGHGQSCRRRAPIESRNARPKFVDILEPWMEWCGEHDLDRSLLEWSPIWRRVWSSWRLRRRLRKQWREWDMECTATPTREADR